MRTVVSWKMETTLQVTRWSENVSALSSLCSLVWLEKDYFFRLLSRKTFCMCVLHYINSIF